jgi:hypothetical protein
MKDYIREYFRSHSRISWNVWWFSAEIAKQSEMKDGTSDRAKVVTIVYECQEQ